MKARILAPVFKGLLALLLCLSWGCDDAAGDNVYFSGHLVTSADGRVLGGESGDWEPSGIIEGIGVGPNPASESFAIWFSISVAADVVLTIQSTENGSTTLMDKRIQPGAHTYFVDALEFEEGMHRVHLWAKGEGRSDVFYSYGDVSIRN